MDTDHIMTMKCQDYWSVFVISSVDLWPLGRKLPVNIDIIDENVLPSSFKGVSIWKLRIFNGEQQNLEVVLK